MYEPPASLNDVVSELQNVRAAIEGLTRALWVLVEVEVGESRAEYLRLRTEA